jgi:lipoate-protein ligase A
MTAAMGLARERFLHMEAECGVGKREFLFVWETSETAVVVGRGGRIPEQVYVEACERDGIPILRRDSGGGAVVLGGGCLNYTLILNLDLRPHFKDIAESYRCILGDVALSSGVPGAECSENDLSIEGLKFGGCAQRRMRLTMLLHGTLLYDFQPAAAERYLQQPVRQPRYRNGRSHAEFLTNAPVAPAPFLERLHALYPETELVS